MNSKCISIIFLLFVFCTTYSNAQQKQFSKRQVKALVVEIVDNLEENYVFSEKISDVKNGLTIWVSSLPENLNWSGASTADSLTAAIHKFIKDEHLRVRYNPQKPKANERRRPSTQELFEMLNNGFMEVSFVDQGIGYLDLRAFDDSPKALKKAEAAFLLLQDAKGIIIDLRNNIGGSVLMVQRLCSYFFYENKKLNTVYNRVTDSSTDYWTLSDSVLTRVDKEKPVYLLTSNRTFSGGEEFAYNLKHLKRATLVGETTRGGAHPTRPFELSQEMLLFVPFARSINPVTGTNWEGVGVKPHIKIAANDALEKAKQLIKKDILASANS